MKPKMGRIMIFDTNNIELLALKNLLMWRHCCTSLIELRTFGGIYYDSYSMANVAMKNHMKEFRSLKRAYRESLEKTYNEYVLEMKHDRLFDDIILADNILMSRLESYNPDEELDFEFIKNENYFCEQNPY